jgi:glycerol kinase
MENRIIAIDQSTSSTKALLFDSRCRLLGSSHVDHQQYYPKTGWVEHDAEEIYRNTIEAIRILLSDSDLKAYTYTLALTNQRETAVVWDKRSGKPIHHAVVWQDTRGAELCQTLRQDPAIIQMVMEHSGLLIDPNFSASGVTWLLDHIEGARDCAEQGQLLMGTIDTWLIWKLTDGKTFATDTTNASRTMLFNIHTLQWDDELLRLFRIPRSMMAEVRSCDALYGETTLEGLFDKPIQIAGVLGDSHGALVGQMCFSEGSGKVTYGTGSSVMVNIGQRALPAPKGLVTSVGFSALGKTFYGYEGNIYSTGATLKWICDQLRLIGSPSDMEAEATSVTDNGGVYIVPAFSGLGAPWWNMEVKGAVTGLTFATTRAHFLRAALESIAYQIKDLVDVMSQAIGGHLQEICADGGPTKNRFLMQWQADLLSTPVVCTEVEDASALGAAIMNGMALGLWSTFEEVAPLRKIVQTYEPSGDTLPTQCHAGWIEAVRQLMK